MEIIYNLGDKTILYSIFNRINDFDGKAEQPVWTRTANAANKKLVLHVQLRCGSLSITKQCHIWRINSMFEASELGRCQSNFVSIMRI